MRASALVVANVCGSTKTKFFKSLVWIDSRQNLFGLLLVMRSRVQQKQNSGSHLIQKINFSHTIFWGDKSLTWFVENDDDAP